MTFQIKSDKKETENKTIRFPVPLIEQIEGTIKGYDVTFSGFVIQACEYALENMEGNESCVIKNKREKREK
ncbi:MAG: hypothetical protein PHY47_17225 [Lachnospiraceae bacterium]|nr:hypothetical protein [Lachnospiraceae bacterium]